MDTAVLDTRCDPTLLTELRRSLSAADEALLCVAYARDAGVQLLHDELQRLGEKTRLVVTTGFGMSSPSALQQAQELGATIRVINPAGASYHPKMYLGRRKDAASALIGSANLTGGLASNFETASLLTGKLSEGPLARAWEIAESYWDLATPWEPVPAVEPEGFSDELLRLLRSAIRDGSIIPTLGQNRPNRVVQVARAGILIETERSRGRGNPPQLVEAWMVELAWDYLRTHGELSNTYLLNTLRVHRSSAVCAILAQLPGVVRLPGRQITLAWGPMAPPAAPRG